MIKNIIIVVLFIMLMHSNEKVHDITTKTYHYIANLVKEEEKPLVQIQVGEEKFVIDN